MQMMKVLTSLTSAVMCDKLLQVLLAIVAYFDTLSELERDEEYHSKPENILFVYLTTVSVAGLYRVE
jgi:hypothetical protein